MGWEEKGGEEGCKRVIERTSLSEGGNISWATNPVHYILPFGIHLLWSKDGNSYMEILISWIYITSNRVEVN